MGHLLTSCGSCHNEPRCTTFYEPPHDIRHRQAGPGLVSNNSCGHMESILDVEMPEQVIWPDQADCGGHVWTRTFS